MSGERRLYSSRHLGKLPVLLLQGAQRAVHLDDAVRVVLGEVDRTACGADMHLHGADRRRAVDGLDLERLQPACEALEVAFGPCRELPVEVERKR